MQNSVAPTIRTSVAPDGSVDFLLQMDVANFDFGDQDACSAVYQMIDTAVANAK
jgi:hypothetical protein